MRMVLTLVMESDTLEQLEDARFNIEAEASNQSDGLGVDITVTDESGN